MQSMLHSILATRVVLHLREVAVTTSSVGSSHASTTINTGRVDTDRSSDHRVQLSAITETWTVGRTRDDEHATAAVMTEGLDLDIEMQVLGERHV